MPSSLPTYKPLLPFPPSLSLIPGLFLLRHTNKRAGMVKGLKLNNLCPTALNTQTGCSQNIKKNLKHQRKGEGRAWQNNRSDLVCVTAPRLLQRAYTQARRCETSGGLGYITFCWLYRKFSQDFKEVSEAAHRPVQPTLQTSRFTQFCVNTASRYHLQIKSQYERSLAGCYPARPALLTGCRSAGGGSTRCCIVPLHGVDSAHW